MTGDWCGDVHCSAPGPGLSLETEVRGEAGYSDIVSPTLPVWPSSASSGECNDLECLL